MTAITASMRHRFDSATGVLVHELDEPMDFATFKATQLATHDSTDRERHARVLWNIGTWSLFFSYAEIVEPDPELLRTLAVRPPEGRTAFVTTSETNRLLLRELQQAQPSTPEWAIFDTVPAALAWLCGDDDAR